MSAPFPDPTYRGVPGAAEQPVETQVTVDCDDAHAQARFWAAALGYLVEDTHDLVTAVLAAGYADRDRDTVEIEGRLAWGTMVGIKHPVDAAGPRGGGRRILFISVPDRVPGRNTWHLDLNVGRARVADEVTRLRALGATVQYEINEPSGAHTTMADPEGNLFCVQ